MPRTCRFYRHLGYGLTALEILSSALDIEVKIIARHSPRQRRTILASFFRQIRPWLKLMIKEAEGSPALALDHTSDGHIRSQRPRHRSVSDIAWAPLENRGATFGFQIRMHRMKYGMLQKELAQRIGIRRSHLSAIERGIHLPQHRTRKALDEFLSGNPFLPNATHPNPPPPIS